MAASNSDLRIVLLGTTGSGKSAAGNTILGEEKFHVHMSPESVTRKCEKHEASVLGRKISVTDTPGLIDGSLSEEDLKDKVKQCVELSLPGSHVFLLVIRLGRFTEEERNAAKWIQKNFGEDALKLSMVLFTHEDQLEMPLDQYVKQSLSLSRLVESCEGGFHSFNNKNPEDRSQVQQLVEKIDVVVRAFYSREMERSREEEEKRRIKEGEGQVREDERKKIQREKQEMQTQLRLAEQTNRRLKEQLEKSRQDKPVRSSGESRITVDREAVEFAKEICIPLGLSLLFSAGMTSIFLGIYLTIVFNNLAILSAIPIGLLLLVVPVFNCFFKRTRDGERQPLLFNT